MTETIDTGGPAFPTEISNLDTIDIVGFRGEIIRPGNKIVYGGLTVREYFATHASEEDIRFQGEVLRMALVSSSGLGILPDGWRITARYMHADDMLKAGQKK